MSESRVSVLLIEDNPGDARLIREFLDEAKGVAFEVEVAGRLSGGLERLSGGGIDVVLLDLGLPDSQGLGTFARVHGSAPHMPIVVLTGLDDEAVGTDAVREGAQDYLLKGRVDGNVLSRSIRYAIERKRSEAAVRQSEARYRNLFENSPIPLREEDLSEVKRYVEELRGSGVEDMGAYLEDHPEVVSECALMVKLTDANRATLKLYGAWSKEDLLARFNRFNSVLNEESFRAFKEELVAIAGGESLFECETVARSFAGESRDVILRWCAAPGCEETLARVWVSIIDLTKRKLAEEAIRVSHRFLEIAKQNTEMGPLLTEFLAEVREYTGCGAAGLRLLDEDGNIPYEAYEGFSDEFYARESPLSIKSDECMCIDVIKGETNPALPQFTEGGSFHMNGTSAFLEGLSEEARGRTRNACNEAGYESIALVPVQAGEHMLGLVHVTDGREGAFSAEMVEMLEGAAAHLGTAIQRLRAEEALRQYTERLETLREVDESILSAQSLEAIARAALRHIRRLVPCDRASVVTFDLATDQGKVLAVLTDGESVLGEGKVVPVSQFGFADGVGEAEVSIIDDISAQADSSAVHRTLVREGIRSVMRVPLVVEGGLVGSLNLGAERVGGFGAEQKEVALEVAEVLAVAIRQRDLHEEVRRRAEELERRVVERTRELEEINAELETFSYSVSHDLRVPLRAIRGYAQILLEEHAGELDAECQRLLNVIADSGSQMQAFMDDILTYSRVGRQQIRMTPIDMKVLVKGIFGQLQMADRNRAIRLEIGELPPAWGDEMMARAVWSNLLANAVKFTGSVGEALIEVGGREAEGTSTYYVKDNGVGFDMRYADKLFGVFQRLHSKEEFEGTGAGLAIVQRIVHRHGGRVWAEGEPNGGATFHFTFPTGGQ